MLTVQDAEVIRHEGGSYVAIPDEWEGLREGKVLQIVDDVVMLVPTHVANATGELLVLRFLEGLMAAGVIRPDDVQKAPNIPSSCSLHTSRSKPLGGTPELRQSRDALSGVEDPVA